MIIRIMPEFHGRKLVEAEYKAMMELEQAIEGEIYPMGTMSKTGETIFESENGHVRIIGIMRKNLTSLPPSVEKLSHLVGMDLRHNSFKSIPPPVLNLPSLEKLWLG